jgi:integrase
MGTRSLGRLSVLKIKSITQPGRHCDGGGLYLQISKAGARSWIFRYQLNGRVRDMGLGSANAFGLADARELAGHCRRQLAGGFDPVEDRLRVKRAKLLEQASAVTFEECARQLVEAKRPSWRSAKHAAQWLSSFETYAFPHFGKVAVGAIDTGLVLKALEPIWQAKNETAGRVRLRIEAVLDAAKARGWRDGDNPARWRGHLENLLARPSKVRHVQHHPALPYTDIGAFMAELRAQEGMAAQAMELLILTATRTSEAIGARWEELDLEAGVWTVPASRIKAGKEHRIPLSAPAHALLAKLNMHRTGQFVFPGLKAKKPLSNMALLKLLERMGRSDITTHGFRSTFRDWAAEQTNFPREVAEMALAHAIENKVEAAYRRGGLFEKRTKLMAAWAEYCATVRSNARVLPLKRAQSN